MIRQRLREKKKTTIKRDKEKGKEEEIKINGGTKI